MHKTRYSLNQPGFYYLAMTLLVLIGVSVIIVRLDLDRRWTAKLFSPTEGWLLMDIQPWQWLYAYGTIPGLLFTVGAIAFLYQTYLKPKALSMAKLPLGPGVDSRPRRRNLSQSYS